MALAKFTHSKCILKVQQIDLLRTAFRYYCTGQRLLSNGFLQFLKRKLDLAIYAWHYWDYRPSVAMHVQYHSPELYSQDTFLLIFELPHDAYKWTS